MGRAFKSYGSFPSVKKMDMKAHMEAVGQQLAEAAVNEADE